MSVIPCDRNGCKSIMCDRYSNSYGRICADCFNQAVYLRLTGAQEIEDFMKSPAVNSPIDEPTARGILNKIFPDRWN